MKKKICVVTGTRAEYGLLRWLIDSIDNSKLLELQIIATGMHLSPEFGLSYKEIENDGFKIDKKIEMLLSADTPSSISKSTGLGLLGFADAYQSLQPDIIVVLGDRFEILAASTAAMFSRLPIAHLHGGETTAGAFDEAIRHSITKMAWWHFVGADEYKKRVIQLGESPKRVFNVGGLGVDNIKKTKLMSKDELIIETGIKFGKKNLLITYHSVTLENKTSQQGFKSLLDVLKEIKDINLIFTMPNADSDGRIIMKMINEFVFNHPERSISFTSMGSLNYLSTLQYIDGVIGNSSSGLAEAPTFKIGTINIGDRQKGRLKAKSIIDCKPTKKSIKLAIDKLYGYKFQKSLDLVKNPYGDGDAIKKIMNILLKKTVPKNMKKSFYDL
jgi:GDP/UDP-N,N'-diacetylbacillosamine 2-epimerase (hydrolysing)